MVAFLLPVVAFGFGVAWGMSSSQQKSKPREVSAGEALVGTTGALFGCSPKIHAVEGPAPTSQDTFRPALCEQEKVMMNLLSTQVELSSPSSDWQISTRHPDADRCQDPNNTSDMTCPNRRAPNWAYQELSNLVGSGSPILALYKDNPSRLVVFHYEAKSRALFLVSYKQPSGILLRVYQNLNQSNQKELAYSLAPLSNNRLVGASYSPVQQRLSLVLERPISGPASTALRVAVFSFDLNQTPPQPVLLKSPSLPEISDKSCVANDTDLYFIPNGGTQAERSY